MEFIATASANIGSSVAAAAAVAQLVSNEVESSAPVQAVQAIKKLTAGQIIKKMQEIEVKEDIPPPTENNIKDE